MRIYQLEVTNFCNLKCSFCPTRHQWTHREKGYLNPDLLDKIDFMDTEYIELQFGGEPTLHPLLNEIAAYIRSLGILVGMSTNGLRYIDPDIFDIITTTIDKERMPPAELRARDNVHVQVLGETHPYEDYSHTRPNPFSSTIANCATPYAYISIHWDGDVVPCCHCFGKQHVFGNLFDMTMEEIIHSHKRNKFLEEFPMTYICRWCQFPNPHHIHEKLLRGYHAKN